MGFKPSVSHRVLKLSDQELNFVKDINALVKDEHLFVWYEMGGYDKKQRFFSDP